MTLDDLYQYADDRGIDIDWYLLSKAESLSVPLRDGTFAVAIDPTKITSSADELVKTAHEIGHCETGAFYNQYAERDIRQKYENRADRWAVARIIPKHELADALENGYTEVWQIADYFGVSELYVRKAMQLYFCGNMNVQMRG